MAPTETLAEQHFATIQRLLGDEPVTLALLTGSTPAARRAQLLARLASGECSLVVGTHALIEDAVRFASLAVAVVDEQHRFGVRQRAALAGQGARRPRAARAAPDGDADPAHAGAVRVRRPRPDAPARAPARTPPGRDARRLGRARARARLRADRRGGSRRAPGVRRLPARRGGRARGGRGLGRAGARRDRRVRAPARRRAARLPARAAARAARPPREAGGDGGVRGGRGRRARRDHGDRGRDRRAERDRDADRERRALRDLAAAPAARARRARRAPVAVPAVRPEDLAAAGCARRATTTASSSPRSTCGCARRAS